MIRTHTAVKIAPQYHGTTVHVLDASKSVVVVSLFIVIIRHHRHIINNCSISLLQCKLKPWFRLILMPSSQETDRAYYAASSSYVTLFFLIVIWFFVCLIFAVDFLLSVPVQVIAYSYHPQSDS